MAVKHIGLVELPGSGKNRLRAYVSSNGERCWKCKGKIPSGTLFFWDPSDVFTCQACFPFSKNFQQSRLDPNQEDPCGKCRGEGILLLSAKQVSGVLVACDTCEGSGILPGSGPLEPLDPEMLPLRPVLVSRIGINPANNLPIDLVVSAAKRVKGTRKETNDMRSFVRLYRDGDHTAVQTNCITDVKFTEHFASALAGLIAKTPASDWEFALSRWISQAFEVMARLRGYKSDVIEQRLITSGPGVWGPVDLIVDTSNPDDHPFAHELMMKDEEDEMDDALQMENEE